MPYNLITMNKLKPNILLLVFTLTVDESLAATMVVKTNMTLSEIAQQTFSGRIWGRNGSLAKLIALNPKVKNPNLIFPGQIINLGTPDTTPETNPETNPEPIAAILAEEKTEPVMTPIEDRVVASNEGSPLREILFTPKVFYSALNSKDKTTGDNAEIPSTLNFGVRLDYLQKWTEQFSAYGFFGVKQIEWEKIDDRSLSGAKGNYSEFGLGLRYTKDPSKYFFTELSYAQDPFFRAKNATELVVERRARPNLSVGGDLRLIQRDPFSLHFGGQVGYLASSKTQNYTIKSGHFYELDLKLKDQLTPKVTLDLTGYFLNRSIDSSIADQDYEEVGLRFGVNYGF